ncbi:extra-large guanine nucleotide-binding protein 1 isoform X1 [Vigna radiata var. radiata]|uniref:Extra-large guanine nucleotide-binding protein 1 isoform X1 n=1 Tax=Vigna radiata var. radiata TaxID=3916 RepID=A0A1S3VTB5_VIGRR|nr:extra-large guanine nucleotide-binding protein 1 isoform X1 [Vigna radiata var. radiata]
MASLLRKLRPSSVPVAAVKTEDSISSSYEYSIAMLYNGPPLCYSIPEIPAFKIDQIPVATIAPLSHDDFSVPVIQPLSKSLNKRKQNPCSADSAVPPNLDSRATGSAPLLSGTDGDDMYESLETLKVPCARDGAILNTTLDTTESGPASGSGSGSTSLFASSDGICSLGEEEQATSPKHVKRVSAVTFCDPESNYMMESDSDEFGDSQVESVPVMERAVRPGKKGSCYKCLKGNRFTPKEVCIVCSAKYCRSCVVRAMGSMPQGRKCVTCIGYRIDERKRRKLGKSSRMMKQLLSEFIVAEVMDNEKSCEENQIPPELVFVNSQPLDREQLLLLLNCRNPPKHLKPGSYWYDKASGFWGKEGQPPSEVISPQLVVGGRLDKYASNGDTNVIINDRLITKKELWVLQLAGVPCEGTPNFWVNADGSYREEGQRNDRGCIWEKRRARLACAILSLPVPSKSVTLSCEGEMPNKDSLPRKILHKFLLVGSVNSGACTIFKQAKLLYNVPFSENELEDIKLVIQSNLFTYLGILLEGRANFETEFLLENRRERPVAESTSSAENISSDDVETTPYSIGPRLKAFSDWLLKYMVSGNLDAIFPAAIREYGPLVEGVWKDKAIQATYDRRNELEMLPRSANYFLDRAVEISKTDYKPSDMDILYAEGISLPKSLTSMEFSFPKLSSEDSLHADYQHDSSLRYQLIRLHPKSLGPKCKWLEMFVDTDVVIFSVALSDYDEYITDSEGVSTNKMMVAKTLFENIIAHPSFHNKKFLLVLTKFDLLEEKIEDVPLSKCEWFSDFKPFISPNMKKGCSNGNNPLLAQSAFQYIAVKFKRLFHSLTHRILFVSLVNGLEPDTVDEALRNGREVMEWEKWDPSIVTDPKSEITSTSIEDPSYT